MNISGFGRMAGRLVLGAAATYGVYDYLIRPWHLKWGATGMEARQPLPGDELIRRPRLVATRAITINAAPADVWPWLAQLGQGRGGFYSYEWLENLIGAEIRNAGAIIPELQGIEAGEIIRLSPERPAGEKQSPRMMVDRVEPGRALVLRARINTTNWELIDDSSPAPGNYADISWSLFLEPRDEQGTRLIVRTRMDWNSGIRSFVLWRLLTEPAHFVMERGMLLGVKKRAEKIAVSGPEAGMPGEEPQAA